MSHIAFLPTLPMPYCLLLPLFASSTLVLLAARSAAFKEAIACFSAALAMRKALRVANSSAAYAFAPAYSFFSSTL